MNKTKIQKFRQKLMEKKAKLVARLDELKAEDPFTDIDRINDNASVGDDAAEESGHERIKVLQQATRGEIADIETALTRINKGTFGRCEGCGGEIGDKRLEAVPTSTVCMSCLG